MEKNQDKGFTLVELLIVIVILGILATVTVFAVRGITDKGQENACATDNRTIETAAEAWYAQDPSERDGGGAAFPSMTNLVNDQLLASASTMHSIGAAASGAATPYVLTGIGDCV